VLTPPRLNPESATRLVLLCLLATAAGCTRPRASGARARARLDTGAPLVLPELTAPRPLPARRVLQLFHSSNAVAELDPCG
jgi:hypothetical protein